MLGVPTTFIREARRRVSRDEAAKPLQMAGMFRVIEKNLENLNAAQIKNLMRKGILPRIYIHLMSLENFGRLLDRKAQRKPN